MDGDILKWLYHAITREEPHQYKFEFCLWTLPIIRQMLRREKGIEARVINLHTIKPLDQEIILRAARECGAIVTAEEHQVNGGLGGAVAEVLVRNHPVPVEMVAVMDRFGRSGKPDELMAAFGIKDVNVVAAAEKVLKRKQGR